MTKPKIGRPTKEQALHNAAAFASPNPDRGYRPCAHTRRHRRRPGTSESGRIRACLALVSSDILDYQRRQRERKSDEATRRQYEDADQDTRRAMVEHAKGMCAGLLDA